MTVQPEPTTSPEPSAAVAVAGEPTADVAGDQAVGQNGSPDATAAARREAAARRVQLREAEAAIATVTTERDALAEQITALHRAEIERIATTLVPDPRSMGPAASSADVVAPRQLVALMSPGDVWLGDATVAGFLDDTGQVDDTKVRQHVSALIQSRPGLAAPDTSDRAVSLLRAGLLRPGASSGAATDDTTWRDVLRQGTA